MFSQDFLRLAMVVPELTLAMPLVNQSRQLQCLEGLKQDAPDVVVFPPLAMTGLSIGEVGFNRAVLEEAENALLEFVKQTRTVQALLITSLPLLFEGQIYFTLALVQAGEILAFVPLPVHSSRRDLNVLSEQVFVTSAVYRLKNNDDPYVKRYGNTVPLRPYGTVFTLDAQEKKSFSFLIDDGDGRIVYPTSPNFNPQGKTAILYSLEKEYLERNIVWQNQAKAFTRRYQCALSLVSANAGESSTDGSYSGYRVVAEAGEIIGEAKAFEKADLVTDIDADFLQLAATRISGAQPPGGSYNGPYKRSENLVLLDDLKSKQKCDTNDKAKSNDPLLIKALEANNNKPQTTTKIIPRNTLRRDIPTLPFLSQKDDDFTYYEEALTLLSHGLVRRMEQLPEAKLVLGLSGGLDSCLALLICMRALTLKTRPMEDLVCISMPGPGSQSRSKDNAKALAELASVTYVEIPIEAALEQHLKDISHDGKTYDVTYENAQARERTQILMNYANRINGFVIGTGDLSELALGWCTYNGDQMSMYNVNASVPKTLVRALCQYEAIRYNPQNSRFSEIIFDVLAMPVSPELKPSKNNTFSQKTEDVLGPYELHDFFLWHLLERHAHPQKILNLAQIAFKGQYEVSLIRKTLETFLKRFAQNQFKRSASPDGASLNIVSLSPRAGLYMPSDLPSDFLLESLSDN